ncbi:ER lumen protein-retaining receptor [Tanacetum coccineum]
MTRERLKFANEAVAIQEWGSFLGENKTPVLLLLDDVWSHSLIEKFKHQAFSEERCDTTVELVDKLVESCQNHPLALKVIGALLIHEKFTVKEVLWTFSIYLEAVAILPQLVLLQRTRNIDNLTGQYVFLLGALCSLLHFELDLSLLH